MPIEEIFGPEEDWELKPVFEPEIDYSDEERKRVKFGAMSGRSSRISHSSFKDSVATDDLFKSGVDDIIYEGELMKFKPGISANFVSRHVQISLRAFRYFRN